MDELFQPLDLRPVPRAPASGNEQRSRVVEDLYFIISIKYHLEIDLEEIVRFFTISYMIFRYHRLQIGSVTGC